MDKGRLDKIVSDFCLISGMELSILNANFHSVVISSAKDGFCSRIHRYQGTSEICKASDIERLSRVRESAAPMLYVCPCGLTEAIVPIVRGDRIIAYMIATMGITEGEEERAKALTSAIVPSIGSTELDDAVSSVKKITAAEADAWFYVLIAIAEHISHDASISDSEESIGTLVKYYVKNNISKKLTLTDISLHLHCSTVTLTEHFKAEFGITIMDYVLKKRMELSEKLLLTTDSPLREIAAAVGFADVEYFSRSFKNAHGVSPASWRRSMR